MTIGERIKNRRIEMGLSVEDVAQRLGKNRATVYRYENGYIEDMPSKVLESLAQILMTTPADLMGWTNKSPTVIIKPEDARAVLDAITKSEMEILKDYRALDELGQAMIKERLNTLLERCQEE